MTIARSPTMMRDMMRRRHGGIMRLLRWEVAASSWCWAFGIHQPCAGRDVLESGRTLPRRMRDVEVLSLLTRAQPEHHHLMRSLPRLGALVDHHGRCSAGARIAIRTGLRWRRSTMMYVRLNGVGRVDWHRLSKRCSNALWYTGRHVPARGTVGHHGCGHVPAMLRYEM